MSQSKNLHLIQLLRGIASLLVVLFHATGITKEVSHTNLLGGFFAFGSAGVDIFFVLSGFIIAYTSRRLILYRNNFPIFLKRRFVRIYPVYWIIITLLILLQLLFPALYRTHYDITAANLLYTYFLLPQHIMLNGVSWTLSYELFFYFLFSLAFLIRDRTVLFILSLLYLTALILLPAVGNNAEGVSKWYTLVFFPMNAEFFLGIFIAVTVQKLPHRLSLPFITVGSLLFIASGLYINSGHILVSNVFNRVILFGIPSFFIIAGVVRYEINRVINLHSALISLGEASYTLYLIHLPVLAAALKILSKFSFFNGIFLQAIVAGLVIAICRLSILFYRVIERPIITFLNKR